ncbi:HNH endonuclease signature motif containing protein [Janibacter terrae]|uniref:HNH endonuclease signature motif containing protein n=1 Tax=Janibacter terrae TaxID=103817 RepID=UPI000B20AEC4|nr:HNH endonuclease signature motif containing protein [Janibacter terrae]
MDTKGVSTTSAVGAVGVDVAAVLEAEPFSLAAPLGALTREDLVAMTAAEAEVVVAATQRLTNALAAVQTAAVTTFADETDRDLDRYREERRRDFEARRAEAQARGVGFSERWFPIPGEEQFAAAALAPLLHVSPRTMSSRIHRARRVDHEMTGTWESARRGDLEPYRTDAIVRASEPLDDHQLEEFEARLFADDVLGLPVADLTRRARRAAVATDRTCVDEAAARARRKRSVTCSPDRDLPGLTTWRLRLPTEPSRQVWAAVDELAREYHRARRDAGEPVTMDQARADAFVDLVLARATVETTVELVVPVAALVDDESDVEPGGLGTYRRGERRSPADVLRGGSGRDDIILRWVSGVDLHRASQLEAELTLQLTRELTVRGNPHLGHAPPPGRPPDGAAARVGAWFVPGHVDARRVGALLPDDLTALLADPATRIRVVGADPLTGTVVTDSTHAYRPGRTVASRVRRRDGTCRFPGCGTPAERAQLDHVTPYPAGATEVGNLVCLCTTHHGFKHHAGWRLTMTPDGTCTWTAPTGRTHVTRPDAAHSLSV